MTGSRRDTSRRARPAHAVHFVAVSVLLALAGCANNGTDFQRSAERFIQGDKMAAQSHTRFHDAVCGRPASTAVGSTFACSARDDADGVWTFEVSIAGDTTFQISGARRK